MSPTFSFNFSSLSTQCIYFCLPLDVPLPSTDFTKFVSEKLEFFFQVNKTPEVTASVLWEMKAFIRGDIISYKVHWSKFMRAFSQAMSSDQMFRLIIHGLKPDKHLQGANDFSSQT